MDTGNVKHIQYLFITVILFFMVLSSCRKDEDMTTSSSAVLSFSDDTIFFDTIFSSFGPNEPISVTKQLWVVNHNDAGVRTNISIKGSANGSVKMNVDGLPATSVKNKTIPAHDSIVIFVQIYSAAGNNFIVYDQIVFETNGNLQDVDIAAYGRDAYYHDAEEIKSDTVWPTDKPHVIYHSMLVYPGIKLTIPAGTIVHAHINSTLYVQGTIEINGTKGNEVILGGDRLDQEYSKLTAQWIGIRILPGSTNNIISWSIIKNGYIGVEVDSIEVNGNPNLIIKQSKIYNMKAAGLVGYSSRITAINNLIYNCGMFTIYGALGGNYDLFYNTLVCTNLASSRQNPQLVLDNSPYSSTLKVPLNFRMVNNIVWGSLDEELLLNNNADGNQSFTNQLVQNNLIRTKLSLPAVNGNIVNTNPTFNDTNKDDYTLFNTSPAKGKGIPISGISTDLLNVTRSNTAPTIGAYE